MGLRALCIAVSEMPEAEAEKNDVKYWTGVARLAMRVDKIVENELGEPGERASIVVGRVSQEFQDLTYGPTDCVAALGNDDNDD